MGAGWVPIDPQRPETLGFLRKTAEHARYITAVCTGSLALGAAGLLRGRRASCHWLSREALRQFGAEPTGDLVYIRVYSGELMPGATYINTSNGKKERIARFYRNVLPLALGHARSSRAGRSSDRNQSSDSFHSVSRHFWEK